MDCWICLQYNITHVWVKMKKWKYVRSHRKGEQSQISFNKSVLLLFYNIFVLFVTPKMHWEMIIFQPCFIELFCDRLNFVQRKSDKKVSFVTNVLNAYKSSSISLRWFNIAYYHILYRDLSHESDCLQTIDGS